MTDNVKVQRGSKLSPERHDTRDSPGHVSKDDDDASHTSPTPPETDLDGQSLKGEDSDEYGEWESDGANEQEDLVANELGEALERDPLGESKPIRRTNVIDPKPELGEVTSVLEVHQELFPYLSRQNLLRFLAEHDALLRPTPSTNPDEQSLDPVPDMESTRAAIINESSLPPEWDRGTARAIQDMLVRSKIAVPPDVKRLRGDPSDFSPERYKAHGPQVQVPKTWSRYEDELFRLFPGGREGWFKEVTKIQYEALAEVNSANTDNNEPANDHRRQARTTAKQVSTSRKRSTSSEGDGTPPDPSAVKPCKTDRNIKHRTAGGPTSPSVGQDSSTKPEHGGDTAQNPKMGATTETKRNELLPTPQHGTGCGPRKNASNHTQYDEDYARSVATDGIPEGKPEVAVPEEERDLTSAEYNAAVEHGWNPAEYKKLVRSKDTWHFGLNSKQAVAAAIKCRPRIEQEVYRNYGLTLYHFNIAVNNGWDPFEYREKLDRETNRMQNG